MKWTWYIALFKTTHKLKYNMLSLLKQQIFILSGYNRIYHPIYEASLTNKLNVDDKHRYHIMMFRMM